MPTKKTQDHKTSHKDPFVFEHDGQSYSIPSLARVKVGVLEDISTQPETQQVFTILGSLADKEAHEAIRDMERDEFEEFMTAWQEHSGISVGE